MAGPAPRRAMARARCCSSTSGAGGGRKPVTFRLMPPAPETRKIVVVQPARCGFSEIGECLLDGLIATPMVLDLGQDHAQTLCVYVLWGRVGRRRRTVTVMGSSMFPLLLRELLGHPALYLAEQRVGGTAPALVFLWRQIEVPCECGVLAAADSDDARLRRGRRRGSDGRLRCSMHRGVVIAGRSQSELRLIVGLWAGPVLALLFRGDDRRHGDRRRVRLPLTGRALVAVVCVDDAVIPTPGIRSSARCRLITTVPVLLRPSSFLRGLVPARVSPSPV